jgi:hypothetical protein
MVQDPAIVSPLDWIFAPNVFHQPPQNIAVEVSIYDLSWWKKFLTHNAYSAPPPPTKKNINLTLF